MALIDPLFDGPLDIVGDIHGEIEALENLLGHLGYAEDGSHPDGRRLVFVGDLVDRGPDSPAVLYRVRDLVEAGRAQCILGNHELALLRDDRKHGNTWWTAPERPLKHPAVRIREHEKDELHPFLDGLPLALERDDLRVVHACWHQPSVDALRALDESQEDADAGRLYDYFNKRTADEMAENRFLSFVKREWNRVGPRLEDRDWEPVFMPAKAELDTRVQMDNPVAVLTSGMERPAREPFWAGGKWRMVERVPWWDDYDDPVPVVVGHYWRRYNDEAVALNDKYGPDLFAGSGPTDWLGRHGNVYCVDFSVGARAAQRAENLPLGHCKLVALRLPESVLMDDDGDEARV